MNATANNGDIWTGDREGDWWMYKDKDGNLYESREVPAYRIVMDNACMTSHGIVPLSVYDQENMIVALESIRETEGKPALR